MQQFVHLPTLIMVCIVWCYSVIRRTHRDIFVGFDLVLLDGHSV